MKNIITLTLALLLTTSMMFGQSLNSFFSDLEDRDDVAIVSVNKEMFKMFAAMDIDVDGADVKEMVKDINSLKIYIQEDNADYEVFKQARTLAQSSSMSELISVKDGSERVYLYTDKSDGDKYVENLLLLVREPDQNIFIRLDGKVNLDDLSKLTDNIGIDGLQHLKKIEE
jgi:arginine repressor